MAVTSTSEFLKTQQMHGPISGIPDSLERTIDAGKDSYTGLGPKATAEYHREIHGLDAPPPAPPPILADKPPEVETSTINKAPIQPVITPDKPPEVENSTVNATTHPVISPEDPVKSVETFQAVSPLDGKTKDFKSSDEANQWLAKEKGKKAEKDEMDKLSGDGTEMIELSSNFMKDMMDPNTPDPIKEAQYNDYIMKMGPTNAAQTDKLRLQLKQNNLDGKGAGNAFVLQLMRGQGVNLSQALSKMNIESARRIMDMNRIGFDGGLKLRGAIEKEKQQDFRNDMELSDVAAETQDWETFQDLTGMDATKMAEQDEIDRMISNANVLYSMGFHKGAAELMKKAIPGVELDDAGYLFLDRGRQAVFDQRLAAINQVEDDAQRKQLTMQFAQEFPEFFGFPGDPDSAVALAQSMNFTNFQAISEKKTTAENNLRGLAIQDSPNLDLVLDQGRGLYENDSDAMIDIKFQNAVKMAGADQELMNSIITGIPTIDSLEDITERQEKEDFLIMKRWHQIKNDADAISSDAIFDTYFEMFKDIPGMAELFTDPEMESAIRSWIVSMQTGAMKKDPDTGQLVPDTSRIIPPWQPNSIYRHQHVTWPNAYGENGELMAEDQIYYGGEAYRTLDPNSSHNTPEAKARISKLDAAWEQYKITNNGELDWEEWYFATKGGTVRADEENIPEFIGRTSLNNNDPEQGNPFSILENRVNNNQTPTEKEVLAAFDRDVESEIPSGADVEGWLQMNSSTDGWMNVNGHAVQVNGGVDYSSPSEDGVDYTKNVVDTTYLTVNGEKYTRDANGKWWKGHEPAKMKTWTYSTGGQRVVGIVDNNKREFVESPLK